jgi:hypothetical protein
VDNELRDLERASRLSPGDGEAGRAYAEALRRLDDRRALFLELARLGRRGDRNAAREVLDWIPWPGTHGPGNTHHRHCGPVRFEPEIDVIEVPMPGAWRVLGASDRWIVLATVPVGGRAGTQTVEVLQFDTQNLSITWSRSVACVLGTELLLHGEDVVWLDYRELFLAAVETGEPSGRCTLSANSYGLHGLWDAVLVLLSDDESIFGIRLASVPLMGSSEGPRWTHRPSGALVGVLLGRPLIEVFIGDDGVPFHPGAGGNVWRQRRTVFELVDPSSGEVAERSSPSSGEHVKAVAWDEHGVLVRVERAAFELRQSLFGPALWRRSVDDLGDGLPPPVLTRRDVVLVNGPLNHSAMEYELQVLDRSTGALRWSAPFPLIRAWRSLQEAMIRGGTMDSLTGALAAAAELLYVALESNDDVTVRGYELDSGTVRFEIRVPVAATGDQLAALRGPRPLQLIVQDAAVLLLVGTSTGATLVRVR